MRVSTIFLANKLYNSAFFSKNLVLGLQGLDSGPVLLRFFSCCSPDHKQLTWAAEGVSAYSDQARRLGAPLEAGEELYQELQ